MDVPRTLALGAACGFLAFGTVGLVAKGRVDREWSDLMRRADAARAEVEARRVDERAVLGGEPGSGEAFEHYRRAVELLLDDDETGRTTPTLAEMLAADEETRAARADELAPILRELRLGARAPRAFFALDWEAGEPVWDEGAGYRGMRPSSAERLSRVAFTAALAELTRGRSEAALALLLDSLQLARDLAAVPLLDEGARGARLLVPTFLERFGEQGGWSLLSPAELERWIDALEIVDDDLETLGDGILVETILDLRSSQHELSAESRGVRSPTSVALRSLASLLARAESRGTYETMLDFQADHAAAFAQEPLRMPGRVRQRYERRARAEGDHALFLFQDAVYATTDRLHGLLRLRLLRHALGRMAGREDVPSTERLGLPIRFEDDDGVCRSFIEPGCRRGKGCCPTVIAIAVRRTR